MVLLVGREVSFLLQLLDDLVDHLVNAGVFVGRTADDVWCPGFVDEDGVNFVDDREVQLAHHEVGLAERHVVAQVVEAKFVVGTVNDVATVGVAAAAGHHVGVARILHHVRAGHVHVRSAQLVAVLTLTLNDADAQPHEVVDRAHPNGVATGQVVVDRDQVDAASGKCVQNDRGNRHQRLSFTGLHFRDAALVKNGATGELHVKLAHAQRSLGNFPDGGKHLGKHLVEVFTRLGAGSKFGGALLQLGVGERLNGGLKLVDLLDNGQDGIDVSLRSVKKFT